MSKGYKGLYGITTAADSPGGFSSWISSGTAGTVQQKSPPTSLVQSQPVTSSPDRGSVATGPSSQHKGKCHTLPTDAEEAAKIHNSPHRSYKGFCSPAKAMARAVAVVAESWKEVHQAQAPAWESLLLTCEVYLINIELNHCLNPRRLWC